MGTESTSHTQETRGNNLSVPDYDIDKIIGAPLNGLTREAMKEKVTAFLKRTGLDHIQEETVLKAAFLARLPDAFDKPRVDQMILKKEESDCIEIEKEHKWNQTKGLWRLVIFCALGAAVQGWDESAVNGGKLHTIMTYS